MALTKAAVLVSALCVAVQGAVPTRADIEAKRQHVMDLLSQMDHKVALDPKSFPHPLSPNQARTCKEISNIKDCFNSQRDFGFKCAGWGGSYCLAEETMKCGDITSEKICMEAFDTLGMFCGQFEKSTGRCRAMAGLPMDSLPSGFLSKK